MKRKIIFILLFLSAINTYGQPLHVIKFIYFGDELKPVGTLLISVEKSIKPTDKSTDYMFGKSVKTDINTFITIREVVSNYKNMKTTVADKQHAYGYEIIDSNKSKYFIEGHTCKIFFDDLRQTLKRRNQDKAVIDILRYY